MEEKDIQKRMDDIIVEYAALPQMNTFDLTLEVANENGDIDVTITGEDIKGDSRVGFRAKKTIPFNDSLDFILDTFSYPNTFGPRSKDIVSTAVRVAYFDKLGYLMVEHDDSTEKFAVKEKNFGAVKAILKKNLKDKFKG